MAAAREKPNRRARLALKNERVGRSGSSTFSTVVSGYIVEKGTTGSILSNPTAMSKGLSLGNSVQARAESPLAVSSMAIGIVRDARDVAIANEKAKQ